MLSPSPCSPKPGRDAAFGWRLSVRPTSAAIVFPLTQGYGFDPEPKLLQSAPRPIREVNLL
jgi:hypothetical protein